MSRKRKLVHTSLLSHLEQLRSNIQHDADLPVEERRRQLAIVYSRRKRIRQNQQADDLTEVCVSLQEKNDQIRAENEYLESLLIQAQAVVDRQEDTRQHDGLACVYQPPLVASSTDFFAEPLEFDQALVMDMPDVCSVSFPTLQPLMLLSSLNQGQPVASSACPDLFARAWLGHRRTLTPTVFLDPYNGQPIWQPSAQPAQHPHIPSYIQEQLQCFPPLTSMQGSHGQAEYASLPTSTHGYVCSMTTQCPRDLLTVEYPPNHDISCFDTHQLRSQRTASLLRQVNVSQNF